MLCEDTLYGFTYAAYQYPSIIRKLVNSAYDDVLAFSTLLVNKLIVAPKKENDVW